MFTLAENKPIMMMMMFGCLNMLLVGTFYNGNHDSVFTVPFITKILSIMC